MQKVVSWRYIPPFSASGKIQMAIDNWLLEKHRQGEHPPCLRFYTWQPAAISLGYHQKTYPPHWHQLTWHNQTLDLVRRPTGGRAVLHQGDLTYALITSTSPGKRLEVYQRICQFLITGWQALGLELNYGHGGREYIEHQNCFATATSADLVTTTGDKFIGSAQLRRGKAILQHGSMMLKTDSQLFDRVFGNSTVNNLPDLQNCISEINLSNIIQALTQAAVTCFKIKLEEKPLSEAELQDIFTIFA